MQRANKEYAKNMQFYAVFMQFLCSFTKAKNFPNCVFEKI